MTEVLKVMYIVKITNNSNKGKIVKIDKGQGFVQGIFVPYEITVDDEVYDERIGGIGSTDK